MKSAEKKKGKTQQFSSKKAQIHENDEHLRQRRKLLKAAVTRHYKNAYKAAYILAGPNCPQSWGPTARVRTRGSPALERVAWRPQYGKRTRTTRVTHYSGERTEIYLRRIGLRTPVATAGKRRNINCTHRGRNTRDAEIRRRGEHSSLALKYHRTPDMACDGSHK